MVNVRLAPEVVCTISTLRHEAVHELLEVAKKREKFTSKWLLGACSNVIKFSNILICLCL